MKKEEVGKDILDQAIKIMEDKSEDANKDTPATDVYSEIKERLPGSKVDIPTEEAVEEAKDWVENENMK